MKSALYFPHSTVADKFLLKSALLLWDKLEYLTPGTWFRPETNDPEVLDALEVVGKAISPTPIAQEEVHKRVVELFSKKGVAQEYAVAPERESYPIYGDKLAHKTWDYLANVEVLGGKFKFKKGGAERHDYFVDQRLGVILMSMLADECAGITARKVTDAKYAHLTHSAILTKEKGGEFLQSNPDHRTCVVQLLAPVLPVSNVTLAQITALRKEETGFTKSLRDSYKTAVDVYIKEVTDPKNNPHDFLRIIDHFRETVISHLRELDRLLGRQSSQQGLGFLETLGGGLTAAYTSYLISADATQALIAGAAATGATGLFKLVGSIPGGADRRETILASNPAAWLYHVRENAGGVLP